MSLFDRLHFHTKPLPQKLDFLMANFQDLQAETARYKAVVPQVLDLINSIPLKIAAAVAAASPDGAIDQSSFDAVVADVKASTDALAAALVVAPK